MKIKKMFSVTLALALLLQIFALALPVSAETVDETDTSSTGAATEAIDLKKQIVPQSEVPALIDYSVAVENKYTCRAYHMETDLNQVVFLKADGSYDTYLFAFPVKYVDENGEVRDKAPELTYNASLTAGKYRMTTTSANDNALFCADVASDGLLYTSDALSLTLRPTTAAEHAFALQIALANSDAELQSIGDAVASSLAVIGPVTQAPAGFSAVAQSDFAPSALNEGITSRAARYALSSEAALSVVPSYNGFQVALGLAKNRTQNTYTFALSTGDATLVNQEGTLLLVNDEGDPLGIVGEFVLVDENGTCGTVAPQVTRVTDGEYLLSADLGDDALVATLSVSQYYDYLQDATIYQANQTSYGSSSHLFVGTLASSSVLGRALIRPNNWNFIESEDPGFEILSATLHIRDVMGDDPEVNVEVRPFTGNAWVESTATWNSVGGNSYGAVLDTKTVSPDIGWDASPRYWYQFDITDLVRDWYYELAYPSRGVMIKGDAANEARSDVTEKTFASSQYSNESLRPYFQISICDALSGTYYIQNLEVYRYMRIDNYDASMPEEGTGTELWLLDDTSAFEWDFTRLSNGYYSIVSGDCGYSLTAPSSVNGNLSLTTYTGSTSQQWMITYVSESTYRISPRSNPSYYIAVGDYSGSPDGAMIQMRSAQSSGKDEWTILKKLPLSGYELDYAPNLWVDMIPNTIYWNCYAYAIANQVRDDNSLWVRQMPGQYAFEHHYTIDGNDCNLETNYSFETFVTCVEGDFAAFSVHEGQTYEFNPIGRYLECSAGSYKVFLTLSCICGVEGSHPSSVPHDYDDSHWYRQDSDGFWSHKPGKLAVTRLDNSGNMIVDPKFCNRGAHDAIGYYEITPWLRYENSDTTAPTNSKKIAEELLGSVETGMTIEQVSASLGSSGVEFNDGNSYAYLLDDGRIAVLNYVETADNTFVLQSIVVE